MRFVNDLQPSGGHYKSKVALGLIAVLLGAYIGFLWAVSNILLGYHG